MLRSRWTREIIKICHLEESISDFLIVKAFAFFASLNRKAVPIMVRALQNSSIFLSAAYNLLYHFIGVLLC